jgi:hypothetical protein
MALVSCPPHHREVIKERYVLAVDLGQSSDPTAIAVLHAQRAQHIRVDGHISDGGQTIDVRYLQRLPLLLAYPEQCAEVAKLLARPPLASGNTELVIDETGVGRAVGDLFDGAGMAPTKITITAGSEATLHGLRRWRVAKGILISTLDAYLHTGELRFAADLIEAGTMKDELQDFRRKVSAAGRFQYEARVGKHDDLVLAVAIGLWVATRPKPQTASFGVYSNTIPNATTYRGIMP